MFLKIKLFLKNTVFYPFFHKTPLHHIVESSLLRYELDPSCVKTEQAFLRDFFEQFNIFLNILSYLNFFTGSMALYFLIVYLYNRYTLLEYKTLPLLLFWLKVFTFLFFIIYLADVYFNTHFNLLIDLVLQTDLFLLYTGL